MSFDPVRTHDRDERLAIHRHLPVSDLERHGRSGAPYAVRIDKGIPIPDVRPRGRCGGVKPQYPWAEMAVGDSFLMPRGLAARIVHSATVKASHGGEKRFIARRVAHERYRVWRIE